ncbi:mitochondrial potassium channel-like isoform X2 [Linepithema humile]|uniref:mitochondrial potassium channel-like isoform X2 n=1 Tax=Linepithema humile TaxID=83485 RepID=UPI00351E063B
MIERTTKLLSQQIIKYGILPNTKRIVASATEKVQSKISNVQNITTEKYNIVAKKLNDQITIVQDLRDQAVPSAPLPKKIVKWWQWYNQLTGLDTVEAAKRQVITLQDKLFEYQDKRRISSREFANITEKSKDIMIELTQTKRDDHKYVYLTKMEHELALQQKRILNQLTFLEKEEKDMFTQLAIATKEYHDSQNLNSQKYKYLSILASALIGIVSLIGSMILNNQRIVNVRNTVEKNQKKNEILFQANASQLFDLTKAVNSLCITLSQQPQNIDKGKKNESNTSNIFMTSAKYSANLLISGSSYIYRGVYACGSYMAKPFYK